MKLKLLFILIIFIFLLSFGYLLFHPIYTMTSILLDYSIKTIDICESYPIFWHYIKSFFIPIYIFTSLLFAIHLYNFLYSIIKTTTSFYNRFSNKNLLKTQSKHLISCTSSDLSLLIGLSSSHQKILIPEKSLFQNILITGTIGSGKTSSAIYPFSRQLISHSRYNTYQKLGLLLLDVKGNLHVQIQKFCENLDRENDYIVLELSGKYKYNPLDKPNLKPLVLANRLKTILLLFSNNNSESYWLDKAEQILAESIKLCRLYNDNYVTFQEIHNLISNSNYYKEKINILKEKFSKNSFNQQECYDLLTAINFYEKDFLSLDQRTLSILKSEITRITNCFISDYEVLKTFSPQKSDKDTCNLEDILNTGKIVILNMNISEYKNLSKIIAAYLKLDFQSIVLSRLSNKTINSERPVAFICDEYHEFVTSTDADFFAQCREAKCINIVSTQSYTSLLNTLNNQNVLRVLLQNLINKIWLRTDDIFTIEEIQKQIGKEEKAKYSKNISENAKETKYNLFTNTLISQNSNISESINSYFQHEFVYDTNFFTQTLETFYCLAFLSDGTKILKPEKLKLEPFFKKGAP